MRYALPLALVFVASIVLPACSDDAGALFNAVTCRTDSDCERGLECSSAGLCAEPGRGGGDRTDTGGNPTLDVGATDAGTDSSTLADGGTCTPNCAGRQCGNDGCGGSCGACGGGTSCSAAGICESGGSAGGTCGDILGCVNTNQCADQACIEGCLATGSPASQQLFIDALGCISDNCGDAATDEEFASCQQAMCGAQLNACSSDGGGSSGGTDACSTVTDCVLGCSDQDCANACAASASQDTIQQVNALLECTAEPCASVTTFEEFYSCAQTNCGAQYGACYGG